MPEEPKLTLPGLARANSIISFSVVILDAGCTSITSGPIPIRLIGVMSLMGSKLSLYSGALLA